LLIDTPDEPYGTPQAFPRQVYIWSYKNFEGNIYVEFEWKSLRPGGLALMMIHASGMGREDFMADYPKKTNGTMQTVFAENVRNYHWEFYREMNDVRNDTGTAFSRKNPFSFRTGFGSAPAPFALYEWHKAQIVARDGKVRAAIDGKILLDFDDNSRINTGAMLNYGHIAIRCMIHTKVVFRNLKVFTEKLPFTEVESERIGSFAKLPPQHLFRPGLAGFFKMNASVHAVNGHRNVNAAALTARILAPVEIPLPAGKREPFGWKTAAIGAIPLILAWTDFPEDVKPTALRLTVGLDVRDEKLIEAYLPKSGRVLGTFEVRFGCLFQVYGIPLAPTDAADIRREGVALRLTKGAELRVFTAGEALPAALQPHLLVPGTTDAMTEYFARMDSLACVQAFSWQQGCVLDGLLDLAALPAHANLKTAARRQLSRFVADGKLVYENHVSAPTDGNVYGIEGTLPFAALGKLEPQSLLLDLALQFWSKHHDSEDAIIDGQLTSSEGAYTVGYPLAVIGLLRKDDALEKLALTQLRVRQARLFDGKTLWRTSELRGGKIQKGDRNWARGIAWQMLGYARTLRELKHRHDLAEPIALFQQLAAWILPYQRADGLWSVFVDQPELTPDTSGSAGIAAALAIGAQQGWLDAAARTAATKTLAGLKPHLTPMVFLVARHRQTRVGNNCSAVIIASFIRWAWG
jgi:unsaturated rhamnogalacturonyl hydrolase